jgi:hypothetical protein
LAFHCQIQAKKNTLSHEKYVSYVLDDRRSSIRMTSPRKQIILANFIIFSNASFCNKIEISQIKS